MKKTIVFILVLLASLLFTQVSFVQAATTDKIVSYHPRMVLRGEQDWNKDNVGSFAWRFIHSPFPLDPYNTNPYLPSTDLLFGEFLVDTTEGDMGENQWYGVNSGFCLNLGLSPILAGKAKEYGWDALFPAYLDWASKPTNLKHTRDEYYADARNKLIANLGWSFSGDIASQIMGEGINLPILYDWLFSLKYSNGNLVLSEADKKQAQTFLIDVAENLKQSVTGNELLLNTRDLSHYKYFKAGLALYEPSRVGDPTYVDNKGRNINQYAKSYLDDFDRVILGKVIPALNAQGQDGGWHGGLGMNMIDWNMWTGDNVVLSLTLARFMYMYNTATGQGVEQPPFGEGVFLYAPEFELHMHRPGVLNLPEAETNNFLLVGGSSGYFSRYTWVGNIHSYTRRRFSPDIAQQNQAELADWLRRNRWMSHKNGGSYDNLNHVLYKDKWVNPRTPEQIGFAKTRRFEKLGWVSMRSGFTSADDLGALFIGQKYHWSTLDPYAQNGFYLERKGELIKGFGSSNSVVGSPILIDGLGQRTITVEFPTVTQGVEAYAPGSTYDVGPGILDFKSNDTYDYISSDATNAYDKTKLEKFTRQLVYLKPDIFVLFDKVSTVNPAAKKSWVIDPGAAPVNKTSNLFTITNGSGALWLKNLSPQETTITSQTADKFELTPSQDAKEVYFITVMQAVDAGLAESRVKADDATLTQDAGWFNVSVAGHVLSFDANGSFSFDGIKPPEDKEPPTTPANLTATVFSSTQINLSWSASTDNVGVTGYKIYRNGVLLTTYSLQLTAYSDTGLTALTTYTYTVSSSDAAGNESTKSSQVNATTQPTPPVDTQAPTVPANLTATAVSSSQINLSWSASTDNIGVTGYKIYRNGVLLTTYSLQLTTYSDTGLTPLTTYTYTISSFDAANNESAKSTQAQAITLDSPPPSQELIIDNTDSSFTTTGTWWASGYPNPYKTDTLAADINRTQSTATATWTPNLSKAGDYQVYAWWTAGSGRINDAKYTITHSSGQDTITADQKLNGGKWNLLGTYSFNAGTQGNISLSNYSTDSNYVANSVSDSVSADAIKLVYAGILPPDTEAPTIPANLQAEASSSTQINLSWSASNDNVGIAGYTLFRDGTELVSTTSLNYSDTGLTPNTTYTYTVLAYDASGNASTQSVPISATTKTTPIPPPTVSGAPVLLFSDLESGPKTGWEGLTTKGAAVSVWGRGFGTSRGANYITVNGAQLTQDSDYAEWGTTGRDKGVVRDLQRTTFWIPSTAQDGAGQITVTVNGVTSNALPFTVRAGDIYFISVNNGNNSYDGKKASPQGGAAGPWKDMLMINPGKNSAIQPGDIIYVRAGIYTTYDQDNFIVVYWQGKGGESGKPVATVGYPNEWPQIGTADSDRRAAIAVSYASTNASYLEWHKMLFKHGMGAITTDTTHHIRIVGNRFEESQRMAWSGVIYSDNSHDHKILGNYFYRNGYDKYKHDLYYKAWDGKPDAYNIEVGWNEFREGWNDPSVSGNPRGGPSAGFSTDGVNSKFLDSQIHDNLWIDYIDSALVIDSNCKNINIYNNVIINSSNNPGYRPVVYAGTPEHSGAVPLGADNVINFYNNTIYDSGNAAGMITIWYQSSGTFNLKNNIFYSKNDVYAGTYMSSFPNNRIISDHDLWYGNGAPPSSSQITVTNAFNVDPQFVNAAASDFHLQSTSPAIDTGTSAVSSVVTKDYDFTLRPQGSSYDIGAYEYVSGTTTYPKGDVNKDNSVDVLDVQALVNHILGIQDYGSSADVNNDGSVDVLDVQALVNIILGV